MPGSKKIKQFNTDFVPGASSKAASISSVKRSGTQKNTAQLTELPIYQLLKAFKLQQYTLKMTDLGYGHDVYKLALLSAPQREDFVS